ncbi:MAG: hypothetical protein K2F61_01605, partial [Muribaculaceae bacterium]|nr:hypothetical protein [Muribaculaceae bacterium]
SVSSTPTTIKAVRDGVASMPFASGIIWITLSSRADDIDAVIPGGVRPGETLLTGGRNVLREFGVTEMPSVVVANPSGLVSDVIVGFNKDLQSDIIEKVALAR